ncbi:MAG: hypothetical protein NT096_07170 [Proteobacteria bacterium]|nr:hypothetical protein [Pseudomonadota bacterium]
MIIRNMALAAIAIGVVLFVLGVYGVIGPDFSVLLAGIGILTLLFGIAFLLRALRPFHLSAPHPYVLGVAVAAAVLHAYEHVYRNSGDPSFGFLVWSMVPYFLCLTLSAFAGTRAPAIAGAAMALVFDLWGHYSVFINPKSSTAALVLLFIPLWSTIIVVPVVTFIAWSITRRRRSSQNDAS